MRPDLSFVSDNPGCAAFALPKIATFCAVSFMSRMQACVAAVVRSQQSETEAEYSLSGTAAVVSPTSWR